MQTLRDVINKAIETQKILWIQYRDYYGNETFRSITVLEWETNYKIKAYCDLRDDERHFNINNILAYEFEGQQRVLSGSTINQRSTTSSIRSTQQKSQTITNKPKTSQPQTGEFIENVKTQENWSKLLDYYRECLEIENRQQYIIENKHLLICNVNPADIGGFFQGEISFTFEHNQLNHQYSHLRDFIQKNIEEPHKQLCFGYPLLNLPGATYAPLIYAPIHIEDTNSRIILRTEDYEISHAALRQLQFEPEQIADFLSRCDQFVSEESRNFKALEQFVIELLGEYLQSTLQWSDQFIPFTLHTQPGLFWVEENRATSSLIKELRQLSGWRYWQKAPKALKTLLNLMPEHDYPEAPSFAEDKNVYITNVNQKQRDAVTASQDELVTVVTGPPGTGKSQLVLNLIANAFAKGESVLFASRNNRAVDVVMDRLRNELNFQGAIRTGKRSVRLEAAEYMSSTLGNAAHFSAKVPLSETQALQKMAQEDFREAQKTLEEIKELKGLFKSHELEREKVLKLLPDVVKKVTIGNVPSYKAGEVELLQQKLSSTLAKALDLIAKKHELEREIIVQFIDNPQSDPILIHLKNHEDQWGGFGNGFLQEQSFETLGELQEYLSDWKDLLAALESHTRLNHSKTLFMEHHQAYREAKQDVREHHKGVIKDISTSFSEEELRTLSTQFLELENRFSRITLNRLSFFENLLSWLHIRDPMKVAIKTYRALQQQMALNSEGIELQDHNKAEKLMDHCNSMISLLDAAVYHQSYKKKESEYQDRKREYNATISGLSAPLKEELSNLKPANATTKPLQESVNQALGKTEELQGEIDDLAKDIDVLLDENDFQFDMIASFKQSHAGDDPLLWGLQLPCNLNMIKEYISIWRNLISFWEAEASIQGITKRLNILPSEEDVIDQLEAANETLVEYSKKLLDHTWVDQVQTMGNQAYQQVLDYASALGIAAGPYDRLKFKRAKQTQEATFGAALEAFPIWATTNLSTKQNFPLEAELFDLVIIDEASQCDVPSAIPLLYRGKRSVIIGDKKQLKHVATITSEADIDTAERFGISPASFQYRTHSLFDIADRCTGNRPGEILLNEHYRSDKRIIEFSNREFYNSSLSIKTDLSKKKNFRKAFLNHHGGTYWIHVNGQAQKPSSGRSAFNPKEIQEIQRVVDMLLKALEQHGIEPKIGIVTPYREQKERIAERIENSLGTTHNIQVGTVHTYQGNEHDFMIFSPVMTDGLTQGSLNWLDRNPNLLNVAITRARVGLFVVGDWDFCSMLMPNSYYRHLADYAREENRLFRNLDDVPLFGADKHDIIGYVLDPHNPEHNRITLRRFLSSCRDYVWWVDKYLNDHILDLFWDIFQDPDTQLYDVRLLTADAQLRPSDGREPELKAEKVLRFQDAMFAQNIDFEIRSMYKRELPHDRVLYAPDQTINMPPFGGAYGDHTHVSEYTPSNIPADLFQDIWERAKTIN